MRMRSTYKAIERIATRAIGMIRLIAVAHMGSKELAMAKVIEFYIPNSFRKPMKWIPTIQRGKVIEFCPQTRKSA
jgi:hypothetical protein